jgi:hypothetical protein
MRVKLRFAPIIKMLAISLIVAFLIFLISENLLSSSWMLAIFVHVPQFVVPFITILYITEGKPGGYGFNLKEDPPEFSHRRMLYIGLSLWTCYVDTAHCSNR